MRPCPAGSPTTVKTIGWGGRGLLGCLRLWRTDAEDDVHPVPYHLSGRGGKAGHVPLGKADADHEILILAVTQCHETLDQTHDPRRRSPGDGQDADEDGRAALQGERRTRKQEDQQDTERQNRRPECGVRLLLLTGLHHHLPSRGACLMRALSHLRQRFAAWI